MKRLALTLALLPSLALAQTKPLPWPCDPWHDLDVPRKVFVTADGFAALWACQVNTVMKPFEIHCTLEKCTKEFLFVAELAWKQDPAKAFWDRATSSTCLGDPAKSYWPTQQERNLCAAVRAEWAAWGLK